LQAVQASLIKSIGIHPVHESITYHGKSLDKDFPSA